MVRCTLLLALASVWIAAAAQAAPTAEDLRRAIWANDAAKVQSLLDAGADANAAYENHMTALFFADDPSVIRVLAAHGAKLDQRDVSGNTALERAARLWCLDERHRDRREAVVRELRAAGAPYTIEAAIWLDDAAFVKAELAKDDSWVNRGAQPLRVAARAGRVEICRLLLDHHADIDAFDAGSGYPILVDAVAHDAVVKLLIERKANLRRRITWRGLRSGVWLIGDEATALHYAVGAGNVESVRLLLAAGIDPSATDDDGQTSLHLAIRFERWETPSPRKTAAYAQIIKCLRENDASLKLRDKAGRTPAELSRALQSPREIRDALGD
jgi:ankyrin repeat protein